MFNNVILWKPGKTIFSVRWGGLFLAVLILLPAYFVRATDFSSTNFTVKDPVIIPGSGFSTSTGYQLETTIGQVSIGLSSTTSFSLKSGFLYFLNPPTAPSVLSPTVVSDSAINLSWSDNSANEDGFLVERKIGAGGTYAQIAALGANVVAYSDTGLSPSTTYFYRVRSFNSGGNSAYSTETSATTSAASTPTPTPSGGGGGGGGAPPPPAVETKVVFSGMAYPSSDIYLLKDGKSSAISKAGPDAKFEISLAGLSAGTYAFGIWAQDSNGLRSVTQSFTIMVTYGVTTRISGIFLPPTISLDKAMVKRGDILTILGQSVPKATISVVINSSQEIIKKTTVNDSGVWLYKFDSLEAEFGDHSTRSRGTVQADISEFSQFVYFKVGDKNIVAAPAAKCPARGDLNSDCKVNLVDFSIAAYWWKRPLSPAFKSIEKEKLNGDGVVNLTDFSIMAYYWTG